MRTMFVAVALLLPTLAYSALPAGWFLAGNDPASFQISRDPSATHDGKKSVILESTRTPRGFGTMMQSFDAKEYRAKRIKLSAWVKAGSVKDWAGVWMRVDGPDMKSLAFDNMQSRPIKGTKDWARYDVVLDVPENAVQIAFGVLLSGEGKVWISDMGLEAVDKSVPLTSPSSEMAPAPKNLDFAQ